ncbi:MAG: aspartate kinase [Muribaculaceae bacterium]|nr:aspartate kinase [Muribaculaceae bacterium]
MKVMKFGGTSVGTPQRMKNVTALVADETPAIVVLSAMSGTTNSLLQIAAKLEEGHAAEAAEEVSLLEAKYRQVADELLSDPALLREAHDRLARLFAALRVHLVTPRPGRTEKEIVAYGERLSTNLVYLYMKQQGIDVVLLDAPGFMRTGADGEPDQEFISSRLNAVLEADPGHAVYLTQGFICRDHKGEIHNLQRGGSDYTASLIGAAIGAEEIQIWTDIDGMHNNDPRFVDNTSPVGELHFDEAAELAYFGAKILHPTCVLPAKSANIPVRLLNTMEPRAKGTVIYNAPSEHRIKAVAAKDSITAIRIKSSHMLLAYGFLRRIFEIFEKYRTPIDMITTSEVGVSVTIDNLHHLDEIVAELSELGSVSVDRDMAIVCVVGDLQWENRGFEAAVVNALRDIPVRMISYGGSNYNISLLIREADKVEALRALSKYLF